MNMSMNRRVDPSQRRKAPLPATEDSLLQAARRGDREAFIALVEQNLTPLYRFVAREIRYHEAKGDLERGELTPDDLVDDVLVTALRNMSQMPKQASFKGWLYHLALQVLARAVRESQLRRHFEAVHLEEPVPHPRNFFTYYQPDDVVTWEDVLPAPEPTPEEAVLREATWEELEQELNELPPDQRQVFVLHAMEGLPFAEIAAMQRRRVAEVKAAYRQARETLRQKLANEEVGV